MGTFTSTITESVELNGSPRGSTQSVTINDIEQVAERIVECPSQVGGKGTGALTVIGNWASVTNAAKYQSFDYDNSKYVRVTNLDTTDYIEVAFVTNGLDNQCESAEAADSCRFRLEPGQSSVMWNTRGGKLGERNEPNFTQALTNLSYIAIWNPTTGDLIKPIMVELMVVGTAN